MSRIANRGLVSALGFTLSALGCLAILGLAVNELARPGGVAIASSGEGAQSQAAAIDDLAYPVRVSMRSAGASYPVRVDFRTDRDKPVELIPARPSPGFEAAFDQVFGAIARVERAARAEAGSGTGESGAAEAAAAPKLAVDPQPGFAMGTAIPDVMRLSYDLGAGFAEGDGIAVRKPLIVNGAASGEITLRLVNDAMIVARANDLARVIGKERLAGVRTVSGRPGFHDFDALRAAGISVQYSAATDTVILTVPEG